MSDEEQKPSTIREMRDAYEGNRTTPGTIAAMRIEAVERSRAQNEAQERQAEAIRARWCSRKETK